MSTTIINFYKDQNYYTIFNQENGTLIRIGDSIENEPFWCSYGPELLDISITNWCDKNCRFCYKGSDEKGIFMSLRDYRRILKQSAKMKVSQVALGGGNPNQHPDFCEILRTTRQDFNIVPSYTTNGRGLNNEVLEASLKYCGAVAVSAYEPFIEFELAINKLARVGIKTNIHFLLTNKSIKTAIEWLKNPPDFLEIINALIFLNYKPVGSYLNNDLLLKNSDEISTFFLLIQQNLKYKIGFDSCSMSGIMKYLKTPQFFVDRCEASRFSMYISEDLNMFPCSFMINKVEGIKVTDDNMQVTWQVNHNFIAMRNLLGSSNCNECAIVSSCFGGCPIFPEINLCK